MLTESCQRFARMLTESCQKVAKKFPESCKTVARKSWDTHKTVMRQSWHSHETLMRQSNTLLQLQILQTCLFLSVQLDDESVILQQGGHMTKACLSGKGHGKKRETKGDTWHVTPDTWPMTYYMWQMVVGERQLPSSYNLGIVMFWWFGGKGRVNGLNNYKGVYRTARATPCVLTCLSFCISKGILSSRSAQISIQGAFCQKQTIMTRLYKRCFQVKGLKILVLQTMSMWQNKNQFQNKDQFQWEEILSSNTTWAINRRYLVAVWLNKITI